MNTLRPQCSRAACQDWFLSRATRKWCSRRSTSTTVPCLTALAVAISAQDASHLTNVPNSGSKAWFYSETISFEGNSAAIFVPLRRPKLGSRTTAFITIVAISLCTRLPCDKKVRKDSKPRTSANGRVWSSQQAAVASTTCTARFHSRLLTS